ncbi:DUF436 family protein, partial [Staphylococcus aureus]|nr:DUF436 family protein [Staphylococcus aureus]
MGFYERFDNVIRRIKRFNKGDICLIGCSTSEVIGEKIGTVGS